MCNQCSSDPRDELVYGARALAGIRDLVADVQRGGKQFDSTGPSELGELLDMVTTRIERAAGRLEEYVPRDFKPQD